MPNRPLVSVIVPIYNVENWLERCVDSICSQSYEKIEIILVDDGSTDNSGCICDSYEKKDERIKVIHKSNGGLSDARNVGLKQVSGEYVSFVDSDDWIEENFIEYLVKMILQYNCNLVGCNYRKCETFAPIIDNTRIYEEKVFNRIDALHALINNDIQQVVWNKLYEKSIIDGIDFEKGKYHEDEFWSYQVLARINRYVETDYIGYNYFQRSNSIMSEKYSLKRLDAVEAKVQRQIFLEDKFPELSFEGKKDLLFACIYQGQMAIKSLEKKEKKFVLNYLQNLIKEYRLSKNDYKSLSLTHKVWLSLSSCTLEQVCHVRNVLNIGL